MNLGFFNTGNTTIGCFAIYGVAGKNFVDPPIQLLNHLPGCFNGVRFTQNPTPDENDGVGTDDPAFGVNIGNVPGFGFRQRLNQIFRGRYGDAILIHRTWNDCESKTRLLQEFFPPGRFGCQNQRRGIRFHMDGRIHLNDNGIITTILYMITSRYLCFCHIVSAL